MKNGTKTFLLLQTRPEDVTSDDEVRSICEITGLEPSQIVRRRLDKADFSPVSLSDYDGIIMAGGPANYAYPEDKKSDLQKQTEQWTGQLLQEIITEDKPFLGICLGMSALVTATGGKPSFDYGEQVGMAEVALTEAGKADPICADMPETFLAVSGHKEGNQQLPESATLLATSKDCAHLIRVKQHVYAVQYHPEIDLTGITVRLGVYRNDGYCPPEEVEAIIDSIDWEKTKVSQQLLRNFVALA